MATHSSTASKSEDSDPKGASSLANVVPAFYYDLIARICPGAAFWITISFVSPEARSIVDPQAITGTSLILLLLVSYLAGIVLTAFCVLWDALSYVLFSVVPSLRAPLGLIANAGLARQWHLLAQKMEAVIKASADPGRTVTKALAEVALCQNLLTGFIVLGVVGAYSSGRQFYSPLDNGPTYLIVGASLMLSMLFRQAMFLGRTQAIYEMYVEER